ncbi:MAG: UDP-N-acetylmuramate--L-alanine ligase [Candidatus Omnitrophota bacterium]
MSKHIHFIGIGGIGMSGIAFILLNRGVKVSGSDVKNTRVTAGLAAAGAKVFIGHSPENIGMADTVVYSSAVKEDNPEMIEARKRGIPLIRRAQALAGLMQDKKVIAVAGSHGKTTTTSLVSLLLSEAGLRPSAAIGGILKNTDANTYFGDGEFFVAEADESDGSFLYYDPLYSIITNIDREHLDYYGNFQSELDAFRQFIAKTRNSGCIFYCADDANLEKLVGQHKGRKISFGLNPGADIYPLEVKMQGLVSSFECAYKGKPLGSFGLSLAGIHNVSNALSVIALGLELGIDIETINNTLVAYKGSGRRMEVRFRNNDYMVIDDYAHHPTEISATLQAARNIAPGRLIAVFQPHRYTRTKLLLDEFGSCFDQADHVIITDIYAASEPAIEGVSGMNICEKIRQRRPQKSAAFLHKEELLPAILGMLKAGDLVVMLGAGDIVKVCDELVGELKGQGQAQRAA